MLDDDMPHESINYEIIYVKYSYHVVTTVLPIMYSYIHDDML